MSIFGNFLQNFQNLYNTKAKSHFKNTERSEKSKMANEMNVNILTVQQMNTLIMKLPTPVREHSKRSALIASFLVENLKKHEWFGRLGIDPQHIIDAVRYHDVGKLSVVRDYHHSFYCVQPHKRKIYQSHVPLGVDVVRDELAIYLPASRRGEFEWCVWKAITEHHEQMNGEGFPRGKSSNTISMVGRITALCDAFDNLLFVGAVGKFDFDSAVSELLGMAKVSLDGRLVRIFLEDREALRRYMKDIFDKAEARPAPDELGMQLRYTPIFDLEKKKIYSYRAETRVNDVYYGEMKAAVLLPMADDLGFTLRFEKLAFEKLCEEMDSLWTPVSETIPDFIFPISAQQFENSDFYTLSLALTDKYEIERDKICFALKEADIATTSLDWKSIVNEYSKEGFKFIIEEAGDSSSIMSSLDEISVKGVCFKAYYLDKAGKNSKTKSFVIGMKKMLTHMEIEPMFSGVKKQADVDFLSAIGVRYVSGDFYGEALSIRDIANRSVRGGK